MIVRIAIHFSSDVHSAKDSSSRQLSMAPHPLVGKKLHSQFAAQRRMAVPPVGKKQHSQFAAQRPMAQLRMAVPHCKKLHSQCAAQRHISPNQHHRLHGHGGHLTSTCGGGGP
jgi:hypothetical protein